MELGADEFRAEKAKIHVCFVVDFYSKLGGVQTVVDTIARHFDLNAFQLDIVALKGATTIAVPPGVRLFKFNCAKIRNSLSELSKYLGRERPDAVISSYEEVVVLTVLANWISRSACKIVWWQHVHFSSQLKYESSNLFERALKYLIYWTISRFIENFIAVSNGVKQNLSQSLFIPGRRIVVLQNPSPTVKSMPFYEIPRKIRDGASLGFVFIGRLCRQKQVEHLLKAVAILPTDIAIRLDIIGDGKDRERLECIASQLNSRHSITFHGSVDRPWDIVKNNSALILCSLFEGYGMVLVEAKQHGVPVITYDSPSGPAEIVRDEVDGIIVPHLNIVLLARAMERLIRDPNLFRSMQAAALDRASRFNVQEDVQRFAEFIHTTLKVCIYSKKNSLLKTRLGIDEN